MRVFYFAKGEKGQAAMNKILIAAPLVIAGFAGAYWLAAHASNETVVTLAGVACGILASIPVTILLWIALTWERATPAAMPPRAVESKQWTVTAPPQIAPGAIVTRQDN